MQNNISFTSEIIETKNGFCETIDKLLISEAFQKSFELILDKNLKYNKDYFLGILSKIKNNQNLEKSEKIDFIHFVSDKEIILTAEKIMLKLKIINFSLEEVKIFLEQYPVSKIIDNLIQKSKREIFETMEGDIVEKMVEYDDGELLIYKQIINNTDKYCIKKLGEKLKNEDFKFNVIFDVQEINGEIYSKVKIGEKQGYIKLGQENNTENLIKFDLVGNLQEINGEIYYEVKLGNIEGYIKLGNENGDILDIEYIKKINGNSNLEQQKDIKPKNEGLEIAVEYQNLDMKVFRKKIKNIYKYCTKNNGDSIEKKDFKFDGIWDLQEINGEIYYKAKLGSKEGYVKLGDEDNAENLIKFDLVGNLQEIYGEYFYKTKLGSKKGYIKLGDENNAENLIKFDLVGNLQEINGKYYYNVLLLHNKIQKGGYIKLGDENNAENLVKFDGVGNLQEINGEYYYIGKILSNKIQKEGYIKLGDEDNAENLVKFDGVGNLQEIDGEYYYIGKIGSKKGCIRLGDENNIQDLIKFNWVFNVEKRNGQIIYYASLGNHLGYVIYSESIFYFSKSKYGENKIELKNIK